MNKIILILFMAAVSILLFTRCNDDDDWGSAPVANTELKSVLQQKGYTFTEAGELVQDDMVNNTTSLDLSNCGLSDVSGLDVFPNLAEVNLAGNDFPLSFDFSVLPATISSVDLTGNEIYEYPGLVDVVVEENGDETVTVLREITKLYLPESAKHNTHELVYFYENKDETADMQMAGANGSLAAYTTLRDIPDAGFRSILKENFPSLFEGEQVDLANRIIDITEAGNELYITDYLVENEGIENVEGAQYIFSHRAYKGGRIWILAPEKITIPFFKVYYDEVYRIYIKNLNTPNGIDLGNAAPNICSFTMASNDEITSLDLSRSEKIGQRTDEDELLAPANSIIHLECCPMLEQLILPEAARIVCNLELYDLPKIEKLDLSQLEAIGLILTLGQLEVCEITYPAPSKWRAWYTYEGDELLVDNEYGYMSFGITEDIYERQATKDFLDTYSTRLRRTGISSLSGADVENYYDWTQDYPAWTRP